MHNWAISRRICASVPVPVFQAGGLRPENVRAAMEAVEPFGLDLCSGVRTNGQLDERKLELFFEALELVGRLGVVGPQSSDCGTHQIAVFARFL